MKQLFILVCLIIGCSSNEREERCMKVSEDIHNCIVDVGKQTNSQVKEAQKRLCEAFIEEAKVCLR